MQLPHIFRIYSRIVVLLLIFGSLIFFLARYRTDTVETPTEGNRRLLNAIDLEAQGRVEDAKKEAYTALNFDSANPYALSVYNKISAKSKDLSGEIAKTREIVTTRPDYQQAWAKLAILYEQNGNEDLAREARTKAEELKSKL